MHPDDRVAHRLTERREMIRDQQWRWNMSDDKPKTLCAYVKEELQVKDPEAFLALIRPATHYCKNCGRSAAKAENVCNPEKFP